MPKPGTPQDTATRPTSSPWWLYLILYLLSVVILGMMARQVTGPLDVDGAYYFLVARNVAQGRGLVVDAMWHFFHPTTTWPQPAGDLWMPLPSLLMAPALLFGTTFRYAQAAQVLLAALLPLLAYRIAREEDAPILWASLAGLATLFAGTVTVHWLDSDCFTAYALVGGGALYTMGKARRDPRWLVAGGMLGGLGAVTRNDGILLLGVLWLSAILFSHRRRQRLPWKPLLLGTALFLVPVVLWGLRNMLAFGRPTAVSPAFFLTMRDYRELFSYRPQPDWAAFWQQGWGSFFSMRLGALQGSLLILLQSFQVWGIAPLAVAVVGLRRRPGLWPALLYLLLLFLALNALFPLLVVHGTWSRSLNAFLPTGYACIALGLHSLVERLLRWQPALPARLVHATFLAMGSVLLILVGWSAMSIQLGAASAHPQTWRPVGEWIQENTATDEVIMAQDPMSVLIYGDRRAIGIPYEEAPLLLELAEAYGVSRVVLVDRLCGLLPKTLQDLYAAEASQEPFTFLWKEGESQIYGLER